MQADYAQWLDAPLDPTRDGATAEALRAIVDLNLDDIIAIEPTTRLRARLTQPLILGARECFQQGDNRER